MTNVKTPQWGARHLFRGSSWRRLNLRQQIRRGLAQNLLCYTVQQRSLTQHLSGGRFEGCSQGLDGEGFELGCLVNLPGLHRRGRRWRYVVRRWRYVVRHELHDVRTRGQLGAQGFHFGDELLKKFVCFGGHHNILADLPASSLF